MDQGFVDLRQNHADQGLGESFWPSFTDIMTTVVMIFMMASTVLIVRNWDLVTKLRDSLLSEQKAQAAANAAQQTSHSLADQLAQLQNALSNEQLKNLQANAELQSQRETLADREQKLLAVGTERDQLKEQADAAVRQISLLGDQLEQNRQQFDQLQGEHTQQANRLQQLQGQFTDLENRQKQTLADLGDARQQKARSDEKLADLESQYSTLADKYQKLIRPARTASGKDVVEVRYHRSGGKLHIQIHPPGEAGFTEVSDEILNQRLSALKKRYGKSLYVRIVIPDGSGLSYSEAWNFTRDLLNKYDYYYQD